MTVKELIEKLAQAMYEIESRKIEEVRK